ncbi:fimbrial protein [Escherichia coli]|nr:fimbrial protein [Escherichia coli]
MRRALFSCFCGLLWISSGWAADPLGTININLHGNVVDFSCTVNTADIDKTVDLGRWPTTQLLNAGDTTALVPFSLCSCPLISRQGLYLKLTLPADVDILAESDNPTHCADGFHCNARSPLQGYALPFLHSVSA